MIKRRRLNREVVVEKAVEMADAVGRHDAVSLTALAAAVEVRVPSLYNHLASLDDLYHAMAVYGTQRLVVCLREAAAGKLGREALLAMAHAYRRFAREHPGIYPLTIRAPEPDDEVLAALARELVQMLLLVLASFGLQGEDALHAVRGFRALLHGFTALEAAEGFKMALDRDESFNRLVATYLDGLTPAPGVQTSG